MEEWLVQKMAETSLGGYTLMMGVVYWIGRNAVEAFGKWNESRKLSIEDKQANREGFTAQLGSLQGEVLGLREENRLLRHEYDEHRKQCQLETEQLHDQILTLNKRLAGVFRKVADISVRMARGEVDANVVQAILDLAKEADNLSHGRDGS